MEEYTTLVQEMATSSKISRSRVDFLPSESTSYYFALSLPYQMAWPSSQECHIQWSLPSVVLRNRSPLQSYMFYLILSSHVPHTIIWSFKSHSYILSSTHQYFHVFTHSNIHNARVHTQYQFTHDCISRPESCLVVSCQFSHQLFQVVSPRQRTAWVKW